MVTVHLDPDHATIGDARDRLRVGEHDLDADFGVVTIDPDADLYAVLVDEGAASTAARTPGAAGPFSNPRIESFGPPQPSG